MKNEREIIEEKIEQEKNMIEYYNELLITSKTIVKQLEKYLNE